jgi:hypothetical protein
VGEGSDVPVRQAVAQPVPVHRHPFARPQAADKRPAVGDDLHKLGMGVAVAEGMAVPRQRPGSHHGHIATDALDLAPPDAAAVQDSERLLRPAAAEQAQPGVDGEYVEVVVGERTANSARPGRRRKR